MKIKTLPEDFIVEEVFDLKLEDGPYTYFILQKKNWNTISAIREIAKRLGKKEKDFGFAGNKDKHAITKQMVSCYMIDSSKLESLDIKDIEIKIVGHGKERITLGMLEGNKFEIIIRDLNKELFGKVNWIINYFDKQRFGMNLNNHLVGKALVKKNFKEACSLLNLEVSHNDYVGALRKHGLKELKLYIHAYQSFLWNKLACSIVSVGECVVKDYGFGDLAFPLEEHSYVEVPIVGFLYKGGDYDEILAEEGIGVRDFIIPQINEISSEGSIRPLLVGVEFFKLEEIDEEMKQKVSFFLPKGAYATMVVKSLEVLNEF